MSTISLKRPSLPSRSSKPLSANLLTGSAFFFISATIVNGGNYLFNLLLGRWLGPAAFADVSLIITLFLVVTFVTTGLQQAAAKFAAMYSADGDQSQMAGLRRWLGYWGWGVGAIAFLVLAVGAPFWQQFFNTQSFWPFILFGIGVPFYFVQGIDRGILQGQTRFGLLSLSYQAEMWSRLGLAVAFVAIGWSINGAVAALTLSILATWLVARQVRLGLPSHFQLSPENRQALLRFMQPVIVAELSLILINNSDVLIVKRFFEAEPAGYYAAVALIGRIVFFATWSIVMIMFPVVAQKQQKGEPHRHLLWLSLGIVAAVSGLIIAASYWWPSLIVQTLFGTAYLSIAPLLWPYAVATALYALSNAVINYRLALGNGFGTLLALGAGLGQIIVLWLFHADLEQVIGIQSGLMALLLGVTLGWESWLRWRESKA